MAEYLLKNTVIFVREKGSGKYQGFGLVVFFLLAWDVASATGDNTSSVWQHNNIFFSVFLQAEMLNNEQEF